MDKSEVCCFSGGLLGWDVFLNSLLRVGFTRGFFFVVSGVTLLVLLLRCWCWCYVVCVCVLLSLLVFRCLCRCDFFLLYISYAAYYLSLHVLFLLFISH